MSLSSHGTPDVGLIEAERATVREMKRLAKG